MDTSVWSLALRRKVEDLNVAERLIARELVELVGEGRVRLLGLIRQEVLSGVRNPQQFEKLRTYFRAFPDEDVATTDHEAAAEASNRCKSGGVTVSVVDVLICSVAIARKLAVFTTDSDFEQLAKLLPLKLHIPRK